MDNTPNSNESAEEYRFLLFISGMSPKSARAIENMRNICDTHLAENFALEIIDINADRQMAVKHEIIGIPTLIKLAPDPKRIILGDLSDRAKVLKILDL